MKGHRHVSVSGEGPPFRAVCECGWAVDYDDWLKAQEAALDHAFGPDEDLPPPDEKKRREIYIRASPITRRG